MEILHPNIRFNITAASRVLPDAPLLPIWKFYKTFQEPQNIL